jgi:hypothetical protein
MVEDLLLNGGCVETQDCLPHLFGVRLYLWTQDCLPHLFGVRLYPLLDIPETPYIEKPWVKIL